MFVNGLKVYIQSRRERLDIYVMQYVILKAPLLPSDNIYRGLHVLIALSNPSAIHRQAGQGLILSEPVIT